MITKASCRHKGVPLLAVIAVLLAIGGLVYAGIELLWRGRTHWSMWLVGGLCFVLIGAINQVLPWNTSILAQMVIAAGVVTAAELVAGWIVNLWFQWGVWDYSHVPYNFAGQICLLYTNLWFLLSLPAILLDDWLRYWWFGECRPRYRIL